MEVKKVVEEQKIWDEEEEVEKSKQKAKKLVSSRFHKWIYVFRNKVSEIILMKKIWDHAIELKKEFVLQKKEIYFLSRRKKEEVHKLIDKQLRKEYIRSLKLPQTAPVFFVGNGKIVQDYRYLDKQTVKNNYPLSLILDIVKKTSTSKLFTKLDLFWGYNNIWIKKGDKQKIVFTILERLFESMVDILWLDELTCNVSNNNK